MPTERREGAIRVGATGNGRPEEPADFNGRRQSSVDGTSRMNREVHVRIFERLGVKLPGPTRQKGDQPAHVRVVSATDDHRAADAGLDQAHAAQNQNAHDALAELRFGDQEGTQAFRWNDQRLRRLTGVGVDQRRLAGQLG